MMPYDDLSEVEKEKDRQFARKLLELLEDKFKKEKDDRTEEIKTQLMALETFYKVVLSERNLAWLQLTTKNERIKELEEMLARY